jgi:hypothetical protein
MKCLVRERHRGTGGVANSRLIPVKTTTGDERRVNLKIQTESRRSLSTVQFSAGQTAPESAVNGRIDSSTTALNLQPLPPQEFTVRTGPQATRRAGASRRIKDLRLKRHSWRSRRSGWRPCPPWSRGRLRNPGQLRRPRSYCPILHP